jgi:hypothetical protein
MTANEKLPEPIKGFIRATNNHESYGFIRCFAADAWVNDIQRNFIGEDAIRAWADKEIIGDRVTMEARQVIHHYDDWVVTARVDGDYDKTNVPDRSFLTFILP